MHAPNCEHRVCRKTRAEDCWCGWRREFGERWEDHSPLNGFHKEERETGGARGVRYAADMFSESMIEPTQKEQP